ncbi:hypothetical protein [Liquorilactobacillus capillatus]|uniref:Uncharacterized protein n=1 Tax=Liquorilactobacillus capillatus DSM 19910 TaxID=1423731 RepID=A0A0R1ME91_9LACO|nr:hypothetical protein [Liquorilactobacillus capillatus]KRL02531.1 hypothetical protein FC81_GL000699 [Liquorilactobacillus capillatus DSM 19910]
MANANTVQLHDKDGNTILPQTDYSNITNKPNLNNIGNIPAFTGWSSAGVTFYNGGKNYNDATILTYRYIQMGNIKLVELKGAATNLTNVGSAFGIPSSVAPDHSVYAISPTAGSNTLRWHCSGSDGVWTIEASSTGAITAQQFLPINIVYMTTNS